MIMKRLKEKNPLLFLAFSLLFGILLELAAFQTDEIILKIKYPEPVSLDLSAYPGYDGTGIPILPEEATYSFNDLNLSVSRVTITTAGDPQMLEGTLSLCDQISSYKTQGAAHFLVNPGGETSSFTARLNPHGSLLRLRVNLEDPAFPVWITSVVFNQSCFHPSLVRILLFSAICLMVLFIWKYDLYAAVLDLNRRSHRLLILASFLPCLLLSGFLLYALSPSHSWLTPLPSQEELRQYGDPMVGEIYDAYAQQLDAFEKGQLSLDLGVNPALEELNNVYDKGERDKKGVEYHWDRAYYDGSYYSYFGLAPLFTVYYPVYWLTGMVPTGILCTSVLAVFAILATFAAVYTLIAFFRLRANLLLCLIGVPAVVSGGMLHMLQSNMNFYYYPVLSGLGWLMVFLTLSFLACMAKTSRLRRSLLFFGSGLSVVMLVLSRPNLLLLAIVFVLPAFLHILLDFRLSWKQKAADVLPFLLPVLIGAAGICWFNYARFGSPLEFGTSFQLTEGDIRFNKLSLSFHHFKAMLYHYFAEPLVWKEFFPFLEPSRKLCFDFGNFIYQESSAGLLNLPLNCGIFLAGWSIFAKSPKAPLQRSTYLLVILGILGLGYVNFSVAGMHIRYTADLALTVSVLSLLLILEHVSFSNVKSGQILYTISLFLLLATILIGFFLVFSSENQYIAKVNPDVYIKTARLLRNW